MSRRKCRNCNHRTTYQLSENPNVKIHCCDIGPHVIGTGLEALDYSCWDWESDLDHEEIVTLGKTEMINKFPLWRDHIETGATHENQKHCQKN